MSNPDPALSKLGNEVDAALKPKVTVPRWALVVAFVVGNILGVLLHV